MEWPEWLSEPQWGSATSMALMLPDDYIRVPGHLHEWKKTAVGIATRGWMSMCFTVVSGDKAKVRAIGFCR